MSAFSRRAFLGSTLLAAGAVLAGCARQAGPGRIRLTQWYHQSGEAGAHEAALRYAREYTRLNPGVEIEVAWIPGDYGEKLATALIAGKGPDVFEGNLGAILSTVAAGYAVPVDDLLTDGERQDFDPRILAQHTMGGRLYGLPMVVDAALLYYRPSLLAAAGMRPPRTADELRETARALDGPGTRGLFLGNDGGLTALCEVAPWAAGAELLDGGRVAFDVPATAAAYEQVRDLRDSGALLIGAPTDWWDPSAFTEGLAAMQWTGLWALPAIRRAWGDDVGVLPWPALSEGDGAGPVAPLGGWAEFVGAGRHVEEAKRFARWLWVENRRNQADWCLAHGLHLPPRKSIAAGAPLLNEELPREAAGIARRCGRIVPPEWSPALQAILLRAFTRIAREGRPAATELADAARRCAEELAEA